MHNLYENIHSGSVVCEKHLGYEATAGFAAKPNAKTVKTSFGTVLRMSDARRNAWLQDIADIYPSGCECCK